MFFVCFGDSDFVYRFLNSTKIRNARLCIMQTKRLNECSKRLTLCFVIKIKLNFEISNKSEIRQYYSHSLFATYQRTIKSFGMLKYKMYIQLYRCPSSLLVCSSMLNVKCAQKVVVGVVVQIRIMQLSTQTNNPVYFD